MKSRIFIIAVCTSLTLIFTGCQQQQKVAIASTIEFGRGLPVGQYAPSIPFTSTQGKQTTFRNVSEPISIIAFISSSGRECCRIDSKLAVMAEKFKNEYITITQISQTTSDCPYGPGCVEVCRLFDDHLILLCDKDKIAWNAYRKPKQNTVFLVNKQNQIVAVETMNNLNKIESQAIKLSYEIQQEKEDATQY